MVGVALCDKLKQMNPRLARHGAVIFGVVRQVDFDPLMAIVDRHIQGKAIWPPASRPSADESNAASAPLLTA